MGLLLLPELKPTNNNFKLPVLLDPSEIPNFYSSIPSSFYSNSTLIYNRIGVIKENPITTIVSEDNEQFISASLPLFFKNNNLIKIPSKVERTLQRYTSRHMLREIHPDEQTAIELCLIFLSRFSSTYFIMKDNPDDIILSAGWKALHSDILIQEFAVKLNTYKKIVNALCYATDTGPILECDRKRILGEKCFHYRLGDTYRAKGVANYELKTEAARRLLMKNYYRLLGDLSDNTITKNLLKLYGHIELPTQEEIIKEAERLVSINYRNKKGKLLTFLNKHSREYYKDCETRTFVEDALEIYDYLTDNGLMIPSVGDERSGGRVVDSFTLMPGWIRNMCRIDGKKMVEVDYSALHPNICCTIYGGNKKNITHQQVAIEANIDKELVKKEHLSFFNKKWEDMMHSPLFGIYTNAEPTMMTNIYYDKTESQYGHKVTSRKLFKMEVKIITEVISKLNARGVYVGYVYDALFCKPEDRELVKAVMDEVAMLHGVYTTAKYDEFEQPTPGNLMPLEALKTSQENELQLQAESILVQTQKSNQAKNEDTKRMLLRKIKQYNAEPIITPYEEKNATLEGLLAFARETGDWDTHKILKQSLANRRSADKKYKISQRQRKKIKSQDEHDLCPF